jgi:argininosuccinate lyase
MIRWKVLAGMTPLAQLAGVSDLVSGLSVRLEQAMKELGERAAVAAELASSMNRRGVGTV